MHKFMIRWFSCVVLSLALAACTGAGQRFDHGLLWKIQAGDTPPSYLFGTMHSEDADIVSLPDPVVQVFDDARALTLEVVLDAESLLAMVRGLMLTDGTTLESHIGSHLYERSVQAMATHGVPEAQVAKMKPWAVAVTLLMPPGETGLVLDRVLYERAISMGKPVSGLETPAEQLALFDTLSKADQLALLADTLDSQEDLWRMFEELKSAYLARDLKRLVELSHAAGQDADAELVERFNRRVITERNHRMVARMVAQLRQGNLFIAVGALHLPGEQGLLNLLSEKGYSVTRQY